MALKPIQPRLRNISNSVAKFQINVAPGDEIEVPEDVAAQLALARAPFRSDGAPPPAPKITEPIPEVSDDAEPVKKASKRTRKAPSKRG